MQHVIAKAFNSAQRRFRVGDPVSETDDLAPHLFADLKARKFIVEQRSQSKRLNDPLEKTV
jgi:hypothetical protein